MYSCRKSETRDRVSNSMELTPTFKTEKQRKGLDTYGIKPSNNYSMTRKYGKAPLNSLCKHMTCIRPTTPSTDYLTRSMGKYQLSSSPDHQYILGSGKTMPLVVQSTTYKDDYRWSE